MKRGPAVAILVLAGLCGLVGSAPAAAGEFAINPLRVTLDRGTRASEVVVRNDDRQPLRMQVESMAWTQDAAGADQYVASDGLLFFPRTMEIPPGESRIIRIGIRGAPVSREDTYRLFIEELPPATAPDEAASGTSLRVFLRVGVPVFVAPATSERKGAITQLTLAGGQVAWTVENAGNAHFRADQVALTGRSVAGEVLFTQAFTERYWLAGTTRTLRYDVPPAACAQLASIEGVVEGDHAALKRRIDVAPGACR